MKNSFAKITILLTLTAILVSVLLLPMSASAKSICTWDVDISFSYNGKAYNYCLSNNLKQLNGEQCQMRGVYLGKRGKEGIVAQLLKEGFDRDVAHCYIFSGFKDILTKMEKAVNRKGVDATVEFHPNAAQRFVYHEGKQGQIVDRQRLFKILLESVGQGHKSVDIPVKKIDALTVEHLQAATMQRGRFSTVFFSSSQNRIHNIALAVSKINGKILEKGEVFSFNEVVGKRDEASGYKSSKVILNGEYTDDFGGGVCQVSTTLYNAALVSDLSMVNVCQHSLVPSYVAPSFDAMVAYPNCDLKFVNDTGSRLYIECSVVDKSVVFTIYGVENAYKIVGESVEIDRKAFGTVEVVDSQKYPDLIYTDQFKIVRSGSDMVKSEGYLNYYRDGKLIARKQIRKNTYKQVDRLIAHGAKERPQLPTDTINDGI